VNALLTGSVQLIYAANQIVAPLAASGQIRRWRSSIALRRRRWPISRRLRRGGTGGFRRHLGLARTCGAQGTAKPIVDKSHTEVVKILADPAVREKSERTGNYPVTNSPSNSLLSFARRRIAGGR